MRLVRYVVKILTVTNHNSQPHTHTKGTTRTTRLWISHEKKSVRGVRSLKYYEYHSRVREYLTTLEHQQVLVHELTSLENR